MFSSLIAVVKAGIRFKGTKVGRFKMINVSNTNIFLYICCIYKEMYVMHMYTVLYRKEGIFV